MQHIYLKCHGLSIIIHVLFVPIQTTHTHSHFAWKDYIAKILATDTACCLELEERKGANNKYNCVEAFMSIITSGNKFLIPWFPNEILKHHLLIKYAIFN